MNRRPAFCLLFAVCAGLPLLGGCMVARDMPPAELGSRHYPPVHPVRSATPQSTPSDFGRVVQASASDPLPANAKPKQILALSGGGMYGSFTAGVLNGETSHRIVIELQCRGCPGPVPRKN